jgi:hypothetical protein
MYSFMQDNLLTDCIFINLQADGISRGYTPHYLSDYETKNEKLLLYIQQ